MSENATSKSLHVKLHSEFKFHFRDFIYLVILAIAAYAFYKIQNIMQSDSDFNEKISLVALVFLFTLLFTVKFAKFDNHIAVLAIAAVAALAVAFIAFEKNIAEALHFNLPNISFGIPSFTGNSDLKSRVAKALAEQYADPAKDEVYWPGNTILDNYAKAAHYNVSTGWLGLVPKFFAAVVYTDRPHIIKITDNLPSPEETWNNIYYGHQFPCIVSLDDGSTKVAWCYCKFTECAFSKIVPFPGMPPEVDGYNLDNEHRHLKKPEAEKMWNYVTG